MEKKGKVGIILGGTSVFLSLLMFMVASAPFAPAIVLLYVTIPMAGIAALVGAWRLPLLAIYFSMMAWFSSPLSEFRIQNVEYFLLYTGIFGLLLAGAFGVQWRNRANIT